LVLDWKQGKDNQALQTPYLLVVRRGDKPPSFVEEGDRVDRLQMIVVLLHDLARSGVVLHDLVVRARREEDVGVVRVELDAVRHCLVGEHGRALAGLRVPQADEAIESRRQESGATAKKQFSVSVTPIFRVQR
jgi:hypothetical protein